MKKVSVIVATYKRDKELKKALYSLAVQSYPNIEIILVDDNGDTEWNAKISSIVHEFKQNHPLTELNYIINTSNQGSAKTRNIGINVANGNYITFLDDDDIYLTDKIKNQVLFMENGDYDYSITDLILYNANDKAINKRIRSYIKDISEDSLLTYHLKYHLTGTDTMMFTKEYLERIGGFAPIDIGDEFHLMIKAIDGGGKFGYLPGCELKAYVHTGKAGLSSGDGRIAGENALYNYKKTFFSRIDPHTRRYIKTRYYAVIAFAELKQKKYGRFVFNAAKAFFVSPCCFFSILKQHVRILTYI